MATEEYTRSTFTYEESIPLFTTLRPGTFSASATFPAVSHMTLEESSLDMFLEPSSELRPEARRVEEEALCSSRSKALALPTHWNARDKCQYVDVSNQGSRVSYTGGRRCAMDDLPGDALIAVGGGLQEPGSQIRMQQLCAQMRQFLRNAGYTILK